MIGSLLSLFSGIWGTKSPWASMTTWGLVLYVGVSGILDEVCAQGLLSADICFALDTWVKNLGVVLTALGLRRAAGAPPA